MSRFGFGYLLLNLLGVTPVIGGTEPTSLPEYYLVGVSPVSFRLYAKYYLVGMTLNWGCSLETNLLRVVTTSG